MKLSQQQLQFFETFGFLHFPGLMKEEIGWITEDFESIFATSGQVHDGTQRSCIVPFIDQRERLCTLLDHPSIDGLISSILGEDFNYLGGDGNFYTGDTRWHSDGFHTIGKYLKVAFYLDSLTIGFRLSARDSGLSPGGPGRVAGAAGTRGAGSVGDLATSGAARGLETQPATWWRSITI